MADLNGEAHQMAEQLPLSPYALLLSVLLTSPSLPLRTLSHNTIDDYNRRSDWLVMITKTKAILLS